MRAFAAVVVLSLAVAGCTPFIPTRDDFGTSALAPTGDIPPEFAEFNAYNPGVNPLLAYQLCATPYEKLQDRTLGATPGQIVEARGRCQTHVPLLGN